MTVTGDRQFHVLLVEDDECTLHVVERLLQNCGYAVSLARNGRQALEVLEGEGGKTVDLILTDLLMPEVSGLELVDGVIHNERYSGIPVVVMSSHDSQAAVMEAFEAGAKDFLIKPIRRNELTTLWQHVWRQNPGRLASQRAGPAARLGEGVAQRQAPSNAEPSGRTLASCNHPAQQLAQQQQQQQQQQPPGCQGSDPGSHPAQQQPVKAEQQQQQQQKAGAVAAQLDRPSSAEGRSEEGLSTDASDTTTQRASGVAAWAGAAAPREADPQLGPSGRLQGVLAAAAAAEHAVPPGSRGVDLDIAPLNLAPPPLFVTSKGVGSSGMPRGLAELAELGAKREVERAHSMDTAMAQALPMDDGPASSLAALHHSSTSAFTHFTALVPPPCPRGGWGGAAVAAATVAQQAMQQQAQMAHPTQSVVSPPMAPLGGCEPSATSRVPVAAFPHVQQQAALGALHPAAAAAAAAWGAPGAELLQQQQQRFLQALQAAIQQHQAATRHMSADAQAHRRAAVEKFRQKRKQRSFEKKVRYESRKKLAEARPRIKGQFVKADVLLKQQQQQQQMELEQRQKQEQQQGEGS